MKKEIQTVEGIDPDSKMKPAISTPFAIVLGFFALFPPLPLHFMGLTPLIFNDSGSFSIFDILIWTIMVFGAYYGYYSILHKQFFPKNDCSAQGTLFLGFSGVLPIIFFICYFVKLC